MSEDKLQPTKPVIKELETSVYEFGIPVRNWDRLITNYNAHTHRKFPLTAKQCEGVIEFAKRGIPAKFVFKSLGLSAQKYGSLTRVYNDMEDRLDVLSSKESLKEEEAAEFAKIANHPTRILMSDIERAEGLADLADWNLFNEMSIRQPDVLLAKMRVRFKDMFNDRHSDGGNVNVNIQLGGDWIQEL